MFNCAGTSVGAWTFEGTIGTNTSTPPLRSGCGECYACDHHTGILKITGLNDAGHKCSKSDIVAIVQFDTNKSSCPVPGPTCEDLDRCEVAFIVHDGTVDGVYRRPCCQITDDPNGNGNGNGNPTAAGADDDDLGDLEVFDLP